MADEAEDVLELEDKPTDAEEQSEAEEEIQDQDDDAEDSEDNDDEESEERTVIDFGEGSDEAAPASEESDSSVIREMRKTIREQKKRLAELESGAKPEAEELGEKPTLASCEYDEDRFEAELEEWKERKAKIKAEQAEIEAANERQQAAFQEKVQAFETEKATLGVANFEDVEGEVVSALGPQLTAALMHTEKPAALMVALQRSPDKLEQLSKLDLPRAIMELGKLEDKVQVRKDKKRKVQPDRAIQGKTATVSADKELARLEKEAERTGDRTALIRYRRSLEKA